MTRCIRSALGLLVVTFCLPILHPTTFADDEPETKLEGMIRERLSKAAGKDVKLGHGRPGRLFAPGSVESRKDKKHRKELAMKPLPWHQPGATLDEHLSEIRKVWGISLALGKGVQKIIDDGAKVPQADPATLDGMFQAAGKAAGSEIVWNIRYGALVVQTAEEEEDDRETHREKMKELIEEVAGDDAKLIGDHYLLVYTGGAETEGEKRIRKRLEKNKITLNFEKTPLHMAVAFLQDVSGLNIIVSPQLQDRDNLQVTLKLSNLPMKNVLNLMTDMPGEDLVWTIREEVIYISTKEETEKARLDRSFILIDISDILYVPPDYPAPKLGLGGEK